LPRGMSASRESGEGGQQSVQQQQQQQQHVDAGAGAPNAAAGVMTRAPDWKPEPFTQDSRLVDGQVDRLTAKAGQQAQQQQEGLDELGRLMATRSRR